MTLMKSLLLGSAAGLVAVASAQAADLPTRKGAPAAEYVRICSITVAGKPIVGWTLPGSDTCFKIGGYVTAQIEGGNVSNPQTLIYSGGNYLDSLPSPSTVPTVVPGTANANAPGGFNPPTTQNVTTVTPGAPFYRGNQYETSDNKSNVTGFTTRANIALDIASNTAYGPLYGHVELQFDAGTGFDSIGNGGYINLAYVTWAGITAGRAPSFYSFTGGGPGWANFFSPDQHGSNQPDLLAYTASFGGGFSATIALQGQGGIGLGAGSGTQQNNLNGVSAFSGINQGQNFVFNGQRVPDIVGNLAVSQGWGSAQVSGVLHQVNVTAGCDSYLIVSTTNGCGSVFPGNTIFNVPYGQPTENKWGWGVDAGVSFNLPTVWPGFWAAGDTFLVTGSYTQNAVWFSGIPDGMWGEGGNVNGNGQQIALADTYYNSVPGYGGNFYDTWSTPTAWSITASLTHYFTPDIVFQPLFSYGQVNWNNAGYTYGAQYHSGFGWYDPYGATVSNSRSWIVGAVGHWDPVKNLDFELELLYQNTQTDQPAGFNGANNPANGGYSGTTPIDVCHSSYNYSGKGAYGQNCYWNGDSSGFAARFEVTRNF